LLLGFSLAFFDSFFGFFSEPFFPFDPDFLAEDNDFLAEDPSLLRVNFLSSECLGSSLLKMCLMGFSSEMRTRFMPDDYEEALRVAFGDIEECLGGRGDDK
jgi:hypothetical protein